MILAGERSLSLLQAAKLDAFDVPVSGDYRYETLQKAIQVSMDALEPGSLERYVELAVFNGLDPVPVSAVEALWAPKGVIPAKTHRAACSLRAALTSAVVSRRTDQPTRSCKAMSPGGLLTCSRRTRQSPCPVAHWLPKSLYGWLAECGWRWLRV